MFNHVLLALGMWGSVCYLERWAFPKYVLHYFAREVPIKEEEAKESA